MTFTFPGLLQFIPIAARYQQGQAQCRFGRAPAQSGRGTTARSRRGEYDRIASPVLLIVEAEDHVLPLGQYTQPAEVARLGDLVALPPQPRATFPGLPGWWYRTAGTSRT